MILLCDYYVIIMLLLCDYYVFIKFLYRLYPKIIMSVSKPHNTLSVPAPSFYRTVIDKNELFSRTMSDTRQRFYLCAVIESKSVQLQAK